MPVELEQRGQERLGTVLHGKYRLDRVLGSGGMAVVYAATHRNQKRLAIKILHPELSMRAEIRIRFLREGYAANTIDHPGAVAVLDDVSSDDGDAFLVMELLEGKSVQELWEENADRLPAQAVLAVAYQVLDVLDAAHAKAIVHRDIKPENLFVTRDGTLKVLDFGIARVREAASMGLQATTTGAMLGTPAFMAPEQAAGRASQVDERTDLWSVGATMFTLLSGQTVHVGETPQHVVLLAATEPARPLREAQPEADPRVAAIVDRALALRRADRWPNATAMREAIGETYAAMFGEQVDTAPLVLLLGRVESSEGRAAAVGAASFASGAGGASVSKPKLPADLSSGALPATPSHRRAAGMTTAEPVSRVPSTARRRAGSVAAAVAALAVSVIGVALIVRTRPAPIIPAASSTPQDVPSANAPTNQEPEGYATVEPVPPSTSPPASPDALHGTEPAVPHRVPSKRRRQSDAGGAESPRPGARDWDTP